METIGRVWGLGCGDFVVVLANLFSRSGVIRCSSVKAPEIQKGAVMIVPIILRLSCRDVPSALPPQSCFSC